MDIEFDFQDEQVLLNLESYLTEHNRNVAAIFPREELFKLMWIYATSNSETREPDTALHDLGALAEDITRKLQNFENTVEKLYSLAKDRVVPQEESFKYSKWLGEKYDDIFTLEFDSIYKEMNNGVGLGPPVDDDLLSQYLAGRIVTKVVEELPNDIITYINRMRPDASSEHDT